MPAKAPRRKGDGPSPSPRVTATDLRKISPFGRNDSASELGPFAPWRESFRFRSGVAALVNEVVNQRDQDAAAGDVAEGDG